MRFFCWMRVGCLLLVAGLMQGVGFAATWFPLGPFGGDARSLAVDPADSRHLFLGTATGWVYDSRDGGTTWTRVSQIANRNDLVIDHIIVDGKNPKRLVIGAWTVDRPDGGIFISDDYGKEWYSQAEMSGQSVRSLARSSSDPNQLIAGTLKGIFRSKDNAKHWEQISPEGSAEIREVQSIAIDPVDPNVIYAGTWHLPWKTTDGGVTWHNIKQGIIDDSDVFSIIVDPKQPKVVYASACSGIYKSADGGELFHKVQGIPSTARRTRKLAQDPGRLDTVFAGTTEGLYRSVDGGVHWERMTSGDVIVNDVYVDPGNSNHVVMATDRGGIFRSEDGGASFEASNDGFSARQVIAYTADPQNPNVVYVGVVNDKKTGGVFQSANGGVRWKQQSDGLNGRDVFSLLALGDGTLLAGTGHGIFRLQEGTWADSSALEAAPAKERPAVEAKTNGPRLMEGAEPVQQAPTGAAGVQDAPARASKSAHSAAGTSKSAKTGSHRTIGKAAQTHKSGTLAQVQGRARSNAAQHKPSAVKPTPHLLGPPVVAPPPPQANRVDAVVYSMARSGDVLFVGSSSGLLRSVDSGQHWAPVHSLVMPEVHFVALQGPVKDSPDSSGGPMVLAGSLQRLAFSPDGGATWDTVALPADLTQIGALAIDGQGNLWVGGREGVWLSTDYGANWQTLRNLFLTEVDSIYFDAAGKRVLVTSTNSPVAFSVNASDHKVSYWDTGWKLRFVRPVGGHLIGATLFDGVVVQPEMVDSPIAAASQSLH